MAKFPNKLNPIINAIKSGNHNLIIVCTLNKYVKGIIENYVRKYCIATDNIETIADIRIIPYKNTEKNNVGFIFNRLSNSIKDTTQEIRYKVSYTYGKLFLYQKIENLIDSFMVEKYLTNREVKHVLLLF